MRHPLTLVYLTSRKEPHSRWFFESLLRETKGDLSNITIVMVDFHALKYFEKEHFTYNDMCGVAGSVTMNRIRVRPKPCVWQGRWKLTKQDYFAASNARNTGLCHAPDGWVAFVDDLSVLMPGWLNCIREAMDQNYIVCGAYKKVKNLVVTNGEVVSCTEFPEGNDSRLAYTSQDVAPCDGGWLFGCSVAGPVEAFLTVNGWPEVCDSLGFEDCCMGVVLKNAGFDLRYDRRMMTYESEEYHHTGPAFRKDDWHFVDGVPVVGGNGHDDKSHAVLNIAKQSKYFPNHFDIRVLRQRILAGEPFPIDLEPRHDWYSKLPLSEL